MFLALEEQYRQQYSMKSTVRRLIKPMATRELQIRDSSTVFSSREHWFSYVATAGQQSIQPVLVYLLTPYRLAIDVAKSGPSPCCRRGEPSGEARGEDSPRS